MKAKKSIGIIGFGNMGSALAERLKSHYPVLVFDQDQKKTKKLKGISQANNLTDLIVSAQVLILAVKPQDFSSLLNSLKTKLSDQLIISIAAGISTAFIQRSLKQARVIRAMPNLAVKAGKGMIGVCKGKHAKSNDLVLAKQLFNYSGKTLVVEEKMLDAVTAVSGSGPGYFYNFLDSKGITKHSLSIAAVKDFKADFKQAARKLGFNLSQANLLVETTISGSISMLKSSNCSLRQLIRQVASKGGTTEAGLKILKQGGTLTAAVRAARQRASQLSKGR